MSSSSQSSEEQQQQQSTTVSTEDDVLLQGSIDLHKMVQRNKQKNNIKLSADDHDVVCEERIIDAEVTDEQLQQTKEIMRKCIDDLLAGPDGPMEKIILTDGDINSNSLSFYNKVREMNKPWYQRWFPGVFSGDGETQTKTQASSSLPEETNKESKKKIEEIRRSVLEAKEEMKENGMYDAILTHKTETVEELAARTEELKTASEQFLETARANQPWYRRWFGY